MYRCYLIRNSRIAIGDDLDVETLGEAITGSRRLLALQPEAEGFSGSKSGRARPCFTMTNVTQMTLVTQALSSARFRPVKARCSPPGVCPSPDP